jgi:uncharacterized protein
MGGITILLEVLQRLPEIGAEIQVQFDKAATQQAEGVTRALEAYANGGLGQIIMENLRQLGMMYQFIWMMIPTFLGLFLIGFQLGRRGFFQGLPGNLPLIRRWIWRLFGIGLIGNVIFVVGTEFSNPMIPSITGAVAQTAAAFGTLALSLFYASGIILLFQIDAWRRPLSALGNVGRMALTNYLMHTLVFTTLFYSYGGGFYGQVSPSVSLLLALGIYAVQIPLSRYWLARFRFGPVEWLWRSMTYGSFQPMRRTVPSAGPSSGAPA